MGDVAKGIKSFKKGMASDVTDESEPKNISENNQDTKDKLVVYLSPTCGCCSGWVSNMEQNGFNVEAI